MKKRLRKAWKRNPPHESSSRFMLDLEVMTPRARLNRARAKSGKILRFALLAAFIAFGVHYFQRFIKNNPIADDSRIAAVEYEIDGSLGEALIASVAAVEIGSNLLGVNLDRVEKRILGISQVRSVVVERVLPDTLRIEVEARRPMAWLEVGHENHRSRQPGGFLADHERFAFLCQTWKRVYERLPVIEVGGDIDPGRIEPGKEVVCPEVAVAIDLLERMDRFDFVLPLKVDRIRLERSHYMELQFDGRLKAKFAMRNLKGQLRKLDDVLRHAVARGKEPVSINLMIRDNVPVIWRREEPVPENEEFFEHPPSGFFEGGGKRGPGGRMRTLFSPPGLPSPRAVNYC